MSTVSETVEAAPAVKTDWGHVFLWLLTAVLATVAAVALAYHSPFLLVVATGFYLGYTATAAVRFLLGWPTWRAMARASLRVAFCTAVGALLVGGLYVHPISSLAGVIALNVALLYDRLCGRQGDYEVSEAEGLNEEQSQTE